MITFLNEAEEKLFEHIVERTTQAFDPVEAMVTEWRGKNGYHSKLEECQVHAVVSSMEYAYDLMCRGNKEDLQQAESILKKVLPLQDKNSESATFGVWPYFLEESLDQMDAPDWNMADFNGKRLYQILRDYGEKLPGGLKADAEYAMECACRSIMRRDMGPGYSNISIMGAYVVMAGGEYLNNTQLQEYALERMRKLHRYNMDHGALEEYNSPSYTWIVLSDLAAVLSYVKNQEFLAMTVELNELVWRCLAEHFHFGTKQWAGPHSRLYGMLQDEQILMQIQRALDYRIQLVSLDREGLADCLPRCFFAVRSRCPEQLVTLFDHETKESFGYTRYLQNADKREDDVAASYLTKEYTLGTFYKSMFWNQRRSHISYFGTEHEPVYCCMRCLHDFYDYSSGVLVTAQDRNRSLTAFGFAIDGGDTHPNLDKVKEGRIRARDLRVRFEFGGAASHVTLRQAGREFFAEIGSCTVHITVPFATLDGKQAECRVTEEAVHMDETGDHRQVGGIKCVDIVLYEGEERELDFNAMINCFGVAGFEILQHGEQPGELPGVTCENDAVTAVMGNLKVLAPQKSCTMMGRMYSSNAWVNGKSYL